MCINISSDIKQYLSNILKVNEDDLSAQIVTTFTKGEGFVGDLVPVTITNKKNHEKYNIMLKQRKCKNEQPLEFTSIPFENETHFYKNIWVKFSEMYTNKTGKTLDIVPHCYGILDDIRSTITLEDLSKKNFTLYNKDKYFDDVHFCLIFKTYGVFHALSLVLKHNCEEEYSQLIDPLHCLWKNDFETENLSAKSFKLLSKQVQAFFDPPTEGHLIKKLELYHHQGTKLIYDVLNQSKNEGMILHGDGWSNNFMFKYDEAGKPQYIKLIDFQMVSSGSPVYDLSYCFYTGGFGEAFDKLNHYLQIYHQNLTETLKEFDLDAEQMYSFNKLKDEWKKYSKFGFAMSFMLWKVKLAETQDLPDFNDLENAQIIEPLKIADDKIDDYKQRIREIVIHMYKNDFL